MSTIKANLLVSPQDLFTSSATQGTDLGAFATAGDGRSYRYFLNGAVTVVPGKIYQGPAQDATNQTPAGGLAVSVATAIGDTQLTISTSTTFTANFLAGGYMSVAVTPGQGYFYKIKGNTATSAAAGLIIYLEDPLLTTLSTASRVLLNLNPYNGAVVAPGTITGTIIGASIYPVVNAQYGWIQTHGPCSCLITGTFASAGLAVGMLVGGTIGSLAPCIAGTNVLGYTMTIGATGQYGLVNLTID